MNKIQKVINQTQKSCLEDVYSDISEIYNNLQDDLELDESGECGYKNKIESNNAVRKYTLKVVKRICDKWEERLSKLREQGK